MTTKNTMIKKVFVKNIDYNKVMNRTQIHCILD